MTSGKRFLIILAAVVAVLAAGQAVRSMLFSIEPTPTEAELVKEWPVWQGVLEYRGTSIKVASRFRYPPEYEKVAAAASTGNTIGNIAQQVRSSSTALILESATWSVALSVPEVRACYDDPKDPGKELEQRVIIGGETFRKASFEEAVNGATQEVRLYRTDHKGSCYEMALRVQAPPGNEQGKQQAWERLELLAKTIMFGTPQ